MLTDTHTCSYYRVLGMLQRLLVKNPELLWDEGTVLVRWQSCMVLALYHRLSCLHGYLTAASLAVIIKTASKRKDFVGKTLEKLLKSVLRILLKKAPFYTRSLLHQYLLNHPNATVCVC